MRKQSKQKISVIQRKLWELCKQITRKRYGNTCYTCNHSNLEGSNWQIGHMWAKAALGAYLKYDLRVLRPQCYMCNLRCGGMGADFFLKMTKEIGETDMKILIADRQKLVRAYDHYLSLIPQYQKILDSLS